MTKRILVTGGFGFIGSHIVDRFVEEGWDVSIVDDLSNGLYENVHLGATFIVNDFAAKETLDLVKEQRFDVVCHQAALPRVSFSVEYPSLTNDTNVGKTVKLLEACKGNVGRVLFASSSSVYGGADLLPTHESSPKLPKSPYALQKSIIEDYLWMFYDLYKLDSACLRYFNVFGPRARGEGAYATAVAAWTHAIKEGRPMRSDGTGEQSRDMCYVANVAEANFLAASSTTDFRGRCYNIACGDKTTNNEILKYLTERFPQAVVEHAPVRAGDVLHTQADVRRAREELGYIPKVKFWDGLELTLKSMIE